MRTPRNGPLRAREARLASALSLAKPGRKMEITKSRRNQLFSPVPRCNSRFQRTWSLTDLLSRRPPSPTPRTSSFPSTRRGGSRISSSEGDWKVRLPEYRQRPETLDDQKRANSWNIKTPGSPGIEEPRLPVPPAEKVAGKTLGSEE